MSEDMDDVAGRALWRAGRPSAPAGCPDASDLAAYADRRADEATGDAVEAALADCREAACLCLAAVAAARRPAIEPVPAATLLAARALVRERPARRVWRVAQWAAAAAAVTIAAQIGFSLGMSTAGYGEVMAQEADAAAVIDWLGFTTSTDL